MIPLDEYPHIPYWFTLRQAMAEMEKWEFDVNSRKFLSRVMLVFNEKYQLLGIVRRRDILRGLVPKSQGGLLINLRKRLFDVKANQNLSELPFNKLVKRIQKQAEQPVSDVMRLIKPTVDYEDNIIKVIYKMVENNLSLLPVVRNKEVVGVVRTEDIFHEIAKLMLS